MFQTKECFRLRWGNRKLYTPAPTTPTQSVAVVKIFCLNEMTSVDKAVLARIHLGTRICSNTFSLSCGLGRMNKTYKLICHVGRCQTRFESQPIILRNCSSERENRMGALIHSRSSFGSYWNLVTYSLIVKGVHMSEWRRSGRDL